MKSLNYLILASWLVFGLIAPAVALPQDAYSNGFGWYEFANSQTDELFEVGQAAKVIYVRGNVKIQKGNTHTYMAAKENMNLNPSDRIQVKGAASVIEIRQRGGVIVRIREGLNIETEKESIFPISVAFWTN